MKKMLISMLLILGLIFTLSACSNEATDSPDGTGIGQVTEIETIYIGALFPSNGAQAELIADLQAEMCIRDSSCPPACRNYRQNQEKDVSVVSLGTAP